MNPPELVKALLNAPNATTRRDLLVSWDEQVYRAVVDLLKEEVDRERLRNPKEALRIAEIAGEVARSCRSLHCQAVAAWAMGNVLVHQGNYDECLGLYEKAVQFFTATGAEIEAARLTANRAWVLKNLGRTAEGVQAAQAALAVLRQHPPSRFLASALHALATLYRLQGRYDEALGLYAETEQIYADLDDVVQLARLGVNRAYLLKTLDRFSEAIPLLERSRNTLAEHERSLEVARADLNLGIIFARLGRYDEALAALQQAQEGFARLENAMDVAVVELHRARLYIDFNLYEELLRTSAHSWELFKERQMQWHAARAILYRVVAWRRINNAARAQELLNDARAAFVRIGDEVWTRLVDLEQAALQLETGEPAQASLTALETVAFLQERKMSIHAAGGLLLAAQSALALDQSAAATKHYQAVLEVAQALDVPSLLYRAYHGLGQVAERRAHWQDAYEQFGKAVETVESLRQHLRVEDFRLGFLEDKLQVYHDTILLCLQLGRDEEAFAYVERAKSGALMDLLTASLSHQVQSDGPVDQELLARLETLREQLNWHFGKLEGGDQEARTQFSHQPEKEIWQQIASVEQEAVLVWRELQRVTPFYASLSQPDAFKPSTVKTYLGRGEVLLQYCVTGGSMQVFAVDTEGLRGCLPLSCTPSQIKETIRALEDTLQVCRGIGPRDPSRPGDPALDDAYVATILEPLSRQHLGWLYDDLLRPLTPFLKGAKRLLVAPDGDLFQVPFHALYDGQGYLLDRYEVAYTPSAGVMRLCQDNLQRRNGKPGQALIVGCSGEDKLPYIHQEIEAVARAIPGARVLSDHEATLSCLQEYVEESMLLHIATHADFRRDNPLFSALRLAGKDSLRAMDLYTLRLQGALVTLSACETGRHRLLGGDLVGLSRGFLYAGASALVVSLWHVNDVSTTLLMEQFYNRMAAGEAAIPALRQAQHSLRHHQEERENQRVQPYAHPFYWAPFCLLGAPEVSLVLANDTKR